MNRNQQLARIMVMEQVFEMEGWREIATELENEVEVIKAALLAAHTWEEVKFLQGKSEQCFRTIYLPDAVANLRESLSEVTDADV